jgi:hypothetical protein
MGWDAALMILLCQYYSGVSFGADFCRCQTCLLALRLQSLPGKNDRNRAEEYDGLFASPDPQCIVTGYPVPSQNRLEMKGWSANRKDWNLFVSRLKVDPWTGQPQKPMY